MRKNWMRNLSNYAKMGAGLILTPIVNYHLTKNNQVVSEKEVLEIIGFTFLGAGLLASGAYNLYNNFKKKPGLNKKSRLEFKFFDGIEE
jgi:hypothetical protein